MPDALETSRPPEAGRAAEEDAPARAPLPRASRRRLYIASAVGLGLVAGLGAAWVWRAPLASALIHQNLSAIGIDSAFAIERLDFSGAELADLRLGDVEAPDLTIDRARVAFAWGPLPRLSLVHLDAPRLRARVSEEGVSLGQLDAILKGGTRTDGGAGLPRMTLEIVDGRADVTTPFGALPISVQSWGRMGTDFAAVATLAPTTQTAGNAALANAHAELAVRADGGGLTAELEAAADALALADARAENARLVFRFAAPNDLTRGALRATLTAANIAAPAGGAESLRAETTLDSAEGLAAWRGAALVTAASARAGDALTTSGAALAANIALDAGRPFALDVAGRLAAPNVVLTSEGRAALTRAWPELGALPVGPLSRALRDALFAAGRDATITAPFAVAIRDERSTLTLAQPIEARGADGARISVTPRAADAPILLVDLATGALNGAARVALEGGSLPTASLDITRFALSEQTPLQMTGALSIPEWRAAGAAISAPNATLALAQENGALTLRLTGPAKLTGPLGGGAARVTDLEAPFDLSMAFGEGMRVAPAGDPCIPARFGALDLPGLTFRNGAAPLCADPAGFFATSANGAVSGGVTLAPIAFAGHMAGNASQRATLNAPRAALHFGGTNANLTMDAALETPALSVALAPDHTVNVRGERVAARMIATGGTWHADGTIENGIVDDATLPANVTEFASRFRAEPRGDDAVIRFTGGAARITDRAPVGAPEDRRPAFNPIAARDIEATLADGRLVASGNLVLERGARTLGAFTATHVLESGIGEARVVNDALAFDARLQPYEISELARGVAENVRGPIGLTVNARWTPTTLAADGRVGINNVSLSSATLPIIEGVRGEIVFDDLLLLTTPPSQRLEIETINPGVAAHNGVVLFQLRRDGGVTVERAEWPFAGGVLAIAPTTITLGAEETAFSLTLAHVDVATLLAELNVPDLVATGTVGGQFPLVLTPQSARIVNGQLSASPEGGTISYAGSALANATGAARLAFGALTSFRYDNLTLELNGDLAGDLVTAINFRGANNGNLNLGGGTPLTTSVAGVPFIFNVRVTAPFRQLGEMAAGAFDPRRAIGQAGDTLNADPAAPPSPEAPAPVDPPAPANE